MAKQPPKDDFLGGFTFNEAGARPAEPDAIPEDTGPIKVPTRLTPGGMRMLVPLLLLFLLAAVMVTLYVMKENGADGITHQGGHSISPDEKPTMPDKNF